MFLLKKLQSKKNDTSNFYVFDILELFFFGHERILYKLAQRPGARRQISGA